MKFSSNEIEKQRFYSFKNSLVAGNLDISEIIIFDEFMYGKYIQTDAKFYTEYKDNKK